MAACDDSFLVSSLQSEDAYPHALGDGITLIETHISWIFLAGEFAYKVKKPIANSFLDYSTLAARKHFCEEELRLNQRFAKEIYLDVVAVTATRAGLQIGGTGEPVEYAVRMRRFASDALLEYRVAHNQVSVADVRALAASIAKFHSQAEKAVPTSAFGTPQLVFSELTASLKDISKLAIPRTIDGLELFEHWALQFFSSHQSLFQLRKEQGHIRECHGDLHLGNVVLWKHDLIPFDGIDFCEEFRWIDTLSDAAFTAMDLAAHGRMDLCHSFINAYFECTGDYSSLGLLPWYLAYRAVVRAKVSALRSTQASATTAEQASAEHDLDSMLDLASRFTHGHSSKPQIWITYGLSGSGKTSGSEQLLQRHGAIRVRSDVERKRLANLQPLTRLAPEAQGTSPLYSTDMTAATYQRLAELTEQLIRAGFSVIVDATCLLKWQREVFRSLADRLQVPYRILAFHADPTRCAAASSSVSTTIAMPQMLT